MTAVEIRDRSVIAEFCRRRPAVHAYELGDLDDFFWPHTRWLGWQTDGRLEQFLGKYEVQSATLDIDLSEKAAGANGQMLVNGVLAKLDGVTDCRSFDGNYVLHSTRSTQTLVALVKHLEASGNELQSLEIHSPSLEDVFIELTGRRLRD